METSASCEARYAPLLYPTNQADFSHGANFVPQFNATGRVVDILRSMVLPRQRGSLFFRDGLAPIAKKLPATEPVLQGTQEIRER
jgi:hypothetical protein